MSFWKDFQEFAVKGNVVDMAVGIMIGAAFTSVVQSLVDDILMPPIGMATGGIDFADQFLVLAEGSPGGPYLSLAQANAAGAVTMRWGLFVNQTISFFIVALVLFLAVRWIANLRRPDSPPAPNTRACPACKTNIHREATRCPACTSQVDAIA